jgi:hypothetical protein
MAGSNSGARGGGFPTGDNGGHGTNDGGGHD